jgi:hypothetical protein
LRQFVEEFFQTDNMINEKKNPWDLLATNMRQKRNTIKKKITTVEKEITNDEFSEDDKNKVI